MKPFYTACAWRRHVAPLASRSTSIRISSPSKS
jgi:hypothetical protein